MTRSNILTIIVMFVFTGCANLNSVYRPLDTQNGQGALIDVKQRAIFVGKGSDKNTSIVCAEPSPDAMSAYAAELAASGILPNGVSGELAASSQEGTSFSGVRTHSIQIMRDLMFRVCEAYMNGAIDKDQYEVLIRRYQKHSIAFMAIEQLTGALRAPPITINTAGTASSGGDKVALSNQIIELDTKIRAVQMELNSTPDGNKENLNGSLRSLSEMREKLNQMLERQAPQSSATGATYSQVTVPAQLSGPSDATINAVAGVVKDLANSVINISEEVNICISRETLSKSSAVNGYCDAVIAYQKNLMAQDIRRQELTLQAIEKKLEDCRKNKSGETNDCAKNIVAELEKLKINMSGTMGIRSIFPSFTYDAAPPDTE